MAKDDSQAAENIVAQDSQQQLLLEKVQLLLDHTDPEKWRKGGTALDPEDRFEKPRHTWENCYTLEIPSGILVARSSLPVKSDFQGKGFMLIPLGDPIYTIEIRAPGWHHTDITDPYKRSRHSDRRCTVLAEGEIAQDLYVHIGKQYTDFHRKRQEEFDQEAAELVMNLFEKLQDQTTNMWRRVEEIPGEIHFVREIKDTTIDCARSYEHEREQHGLTVKRFRLTSEIKDPTLAREFFQRVSSLGQTSRLLSLTKALEEL